MLHQALLTHCFFPTPLARSFAVLSLEATSQRTLQMLSGMFEKAAITSNVTLPVVPKSHDDLFLQPARESIGERPCVNGDRCLANFIAQVRYGAETNKAFTCKEFLLPDQYAKFRAGGGLPQRKGKCLLCSRYFQSYVFLLARTDPAFKVGKSSLGMQVFCADGSSLPQLLHASATAATGVLRA